MLVGLHVVTKLWKSIIGGGGDFPPALPPPPPATLMAGNAKEADIWFGRESAREARGKFKYLVCLVVFLCWIKRFVLLSLCLRCKYMNIYFQAFKNRGGGGGGDDPPRKIRGGDTSPPGSPPMECIDLEVVVHEYQWCIFVFLEN